MCSFPRPDGAGADAAADPSGKAAAVQVEMEAEAASDDEEAATGAGAASMAAFPKKLPERVAAVRNAVLRGGTARSANLCPVNVSIESVNDETRTPIVEISVVVRVIHAVAGQLTDEDRAAIPPYVAVSGVMRAWPYERAEVQALSSKLAMPPLVLPVLVTGSTTQLAVQQGHRRGRRKRRGGHRRSPRGGLAASRREGRSGSAALTVGVRRRHRGHG